MVEKLREIRERFDEIERDRKGLRLREDDGVRRTVSAQNYRLTSSLVDESNIIGRESEKEKIVKLLLSDVQVSNKITVIPIVGMGGVGKTTLAQLIYNDPRIRQYFDLRIWIYVSEDFDLVKLTKEIYRSITNKSCEEHVGFDYLQDSIKKELMKFKRMFLVLDDVWNEKQFLWESLKVPFHNAGVVNILLTTRNEKVADVMRTMNYCRLGFLSKDEGWRLFNQYALCGDENLMRIGQKIVNKCDGLPLAIKLLGSHLQFERDEDKWMSILESELWDLDPGTNEIFPALKLSYQRMPIHLKPCFRYCSLFPKKHIPDKNCLVWLWIAQGYIQPKIRGKTMEETGREYLDELLGRSFFQATESTDYFEMHDLIYDLAVFISLSSLFNSLHSMVNVKVLDLSGVHYPIMLPASIKNFINLRHLILPDDSFMPCGISKLTCLQTLKKIVVQDGNHESGGLGEIENLASLTGSCCICNIKYANNVEDFKKANINGKKQIRRLFIDWHSTMIYSNDKVKKQSFELEEVKLEALRPHNNLKKLEIHNYPGILFPLWLGDPSYCKLQDITLQGCNEWDGSGRVLDRDLPCLRSIFILDCAMLKNIKIVQSSSLRRLLVEECPNITSLHGLCSLHRLEKLEIRGCNNLLISAEEILPSKLQFVCFKDCWELTSIPGLQNLPSLKELKLIRCPKLELTLEEKLSTIPSVLKIANCPGLEKWCQIYGFKYIQVCLISPQIL
ncbi:Putative disease resistance protein RGA3 [Dendrobium catenatum]|uniref:Disease resistance protein RGA3 n=1 Tax=Dendrobium catenatum TaxID=906689 RepID=A0A2I0VKZ3_9ASPA|nr:Putative disease resistance protein RGA3 [Dendrobium catenatum]